MGELHKDITGTGLHVPKAHDNTYHSTNFEPEISPKQNAFNKAYGNTSDTICQGNDVRLTNDRVPTVHDNTKHSTNYEAEFSKNTGFNKNFGTGSGDVAQGNRGIPSGGTTGQVLAKSSGTDYAVGWVDQTGGSSYFFLYETNAYISGGNDGADPYSTSHYEYDKLTDSYTAMTDIVSDFWAHAYCRSGNDSMLRVGGNDGATQDDVESYSIPFNSWTTETVFPTVNLRPCGANAGFDVFIHGGYNGAAETELMKSYSIVSGSWTSHTGSGGGSIATDFNRESQLIYDNDDVFYETGGQYEATTAARNRSYTKSTDTWNLSLATTVVGNSGRGVFYDGDVYWSGFDIHIKKYDPAGDSWVTTLTEDTGFAASSDVMTGNQDMIDMHAGTLGTQHRRYDIPGDSFSAQTVYPVAVTEHAGF